MIHGSPQVIHQGYLEHAVHSLFKGENIQVNVRKNAKIKNTSTGGLLELDVWLPDKQICFEFQDPYHYATSWDSNIPLGVVKKKDAMKKEEMHGRGETVVVVPFWWDGSEVSLAHTVRFQRPDLLTGVLSEGHIIPLNPELHLFKDMIPNVGELMLASFPPISFKTDSIGARNFWWLGEKYDGLRVVWNPRRRCLYSRYAYEITYPHAQQFPVSAFLDGEIWFGRGQFVEVQSFVNNEEHDWNSLRMIGFDDAAPTLRRSPFETRYANIVFAVPPSNPLITIATRIACVREDLLSFLTNAIIGDHGEGVIIRKPLSRYIPGRSHNLCKLKAARGDAEGLVTEPDQGDGWLLVQLPNGKTVRIQKQENEVVKPKRGDIVSFVYDNFSQRALPVNPKMERIRPDLTWEHVVREFQKAKSETLKLNEESSRIFGRRRQVSAHKEEKLRKSMKAFLDNFAESKNFDPLNASNWYLADQTEMRGLKGASKLMKHYNGSLVLAIIDLYSSVKFDKTKFKIVPHNYWASETNRRNYLIRFAANRGFDALVAKNWYKANVIGFHKTKGIASVVYYHGGSFRKALLHLFPEIGLDKSQVKFTRTSIGKLDFSKQEARTNFFVNFAKSRNFDPLEPNEWYNVNLRNLKRERGYRTVLVHHCSSLIRALSAAFPDIGLENKKYAFLAKNKFKDPKKRREFFVQFAKSRNFDPLIANNWYSIRKKDVINEKGIFAVLSFHKENLISALCTLFPEIGLQKSMFGVVHRHFWADAHNRKNFLFEFAREHKFDPLIAENWYHIKRSDLGSKHHLLQYHKFRIANAIADLLPDIGIDKEKFLHT